jgi:hypothetical protein
LINFGSSSFSLLEAATIDGKDKTLQVNGMKQQVQKLTQLLDIYEIDSKKNKQSLEASTAYESFEFLFKFVNILV